MRRYKTKHDAVVIEKPEPFNTEQTIASGVISLIAFVVAIAGGFSVLQ